MTPEQSSLVEAVAKAIGDAARNRHGGTMMGWAVSPDREDCLVFARAALEAMQGAVDHVPPERIDKLSDQFQSDILHMTDYHCVGELYRGVLDASKAGT
jgi:hypothetical protein